MGFLAVVRYTIEEQGSTRRGESVLPYLDALTVEDARGRLSNDIKNARFRAFQARGRLSAAAKLTITSSELFRLEAVEATASSHMANAEHEPDGPHVLRACNGERMCRLCLAINPPNSCTSATIGGCERIAALYGPAKVMRPDGTIVLLGKIA